MNSDPLSESIPTMGNGNSAITCSKASKTQMAALFFTDRLMVQPVAMSVTVRVKQNSPLELPPSWPTRSISTNPPGPRSTRPGADGDLGLEEGAGLVWERPLKPNRPAGREVAVDGGRAHGDEEGGLGVGQNDVAVPSQQRDHRGQHGSQALARRGPGQRPARHQTGDHTDAILRGRASSCHRLDQPGAADRGPGMVPVPPVSSTSSSRILDFSALEPRL